MLNHIAIMGRLTRDPELAGTPFTLRQLGCIVIAAAATYGIYTVASILKLPIDVFGFICLIPAAIAFLFGWVRPFGIPMERFLRTVWVSNVLAPTRRQYVTVNIIREDDLSENMTNRGKKKYKISSEAVR